MLFSVRYVAERTSSEASAALLCVHCATFVEPMMQQVSNATLGAVWCLASLLGALVQKTVLICACVVLHYAHAQMRASFRFMRMRKCDQSCSYWLATQT